VHLWSKKSCFVGHERLCGGAEPPFSSIAVRAQPLANSEVNPGLLARRPASRNGRQNPACGDGSTRPGDAGITPQHG
jgi:hypothetical protein